MAQDRQAGIGHMAVLHGCAAKCHPVPKTSQIDHSFPGHTSPGLLIILEILFITGEIHGN